MTEAELSEMEELACPGCGSCAGMFTANTMNCLMEALGMALPGNARSLLLIPGACIWPEKPEKQILTLLSKNIRPARYHQSAIAGKCFCCGYGAGRQYNTVLHLPAVASEAGIKFPLKRINEISKKTPYLSKLSPAGEMHIQDLDRAGGIPAVMKEVKSLLHTELMTVTGQNDR